MTRKDYIKNVGHMERFWIPFSSSSSSESFTAQYMSLREWNEMHYLCQSSESCIEDRLFQTVSELQRRRVAIRYACLWAVTAAHSRASKTRSVNLINESSSRRRRRQATSSSSPSSYFNNISSSSCSVFEEDVIYYSFLQLHVSGTYHLPRIRVVPLEAANRIIEPN